MQLFGEMVIWFDGQGDLTIDLNDEKSKAMLKIWESLWEHRRTQNLMDYAYLLI